MKYICHDTNIQYLHALINVTTWLDGHWTKISYGREKNSLTRHYRQWKSASVIQFFFISKKISGWEREIATNKLTTMSLNIGHF